MSPRRAHDLLTNIDMGEQKPPEWMVRVKEDYFKGGDSFFRSPELYELLDHDRRRRASHPGGLDGDRFAVEGSGVPEHPALGVPLDDVVHERLGDVLRPEGIAREQAGLRVVTLVRTYVDWHGGEAYGFPA